MPNKSKSDLREEVWQEMERQKQGAFPFPLKGRIPNFKGAKEAARQITVTQPFKEAKVLKINPDTPQKPLREKALREGKSVIMPAPRLRKGFYLLEDLKEVSGKAAVKKNVPQYGKIVSPSNLPEVDMIITGSVAAGKDGSRTGKGHGFAEIEFGILRETGKVNQHTPIATTVHDLQLYPAIPMEKHDVPVDLIGTPATLITTDSSHPRPEGIYRNLINEEMLQEMPVLREVI